MRSTLTFLLISLICSSALSQGITGVVVDEETNTPLPYANVEVKGTAFGTITGEQGLFTLNYNFANNDTITFSFLGYKAKSYNVNDFVQKKINKILLSPDAIVLGEATVSADLPITILRNVIARRAENRGPLSYESRVFCRIHTTENGATKKLGEFVADALNRPDTISRNFAIVEGREINDTPRLDLNLNMASSFNDNFNQDISPLLQHPNRHNFTLEGSTNVNGSEVYVVSVMTDYKKNKARRQIKIYVEKDTYALVAYEINALPEYIGYCEVHGAALIRALMRCKINGVTNLYNRTTYTKIDGHWYLKSYISKWGCNVHDFKFDTDFNHFDNVESVVTDFIFPPKHDNEYFNRRQVYSSILIKDYNEDFWKNYNIIPINEELNAKIK